MTSQISNRITTSDPLAWTAYHRVCLCMCMVNQSLDRNFSAVCVDSSDDDDDDAEVKYYNKYHWQSRVEIEGLVLFL